MPSVSKTNIQSPQSRTVGKKSRFISLSKPNRIDREFLIEAFKGLMPFQYDLKQASEPVDFGAISRDFFGVCLAIPTDSKQCQYILDSIRELGVGTVRVDFSYDQEVQLAKSLLVGLQQLGVNVLLHLVAPLEAAKQMPKKPVIKEWGAFIESSIQHFDGLFEALEIGATINRVRWSGSDLTGFRAMWTEAYSVCLEHSVTLVGPNITDFEPQYNAGVLGILSKRGLLPEIHSNNLFAERAIEPENADHKILGFALRNLHGYDLRKKIALLASISARYGLTRNWSTCAFWTIPRIERILKNPEQKMADYLIRYFVICATSGRFERIFWGPLVSYREGLIDDGTGDRSSSDNRDVVAYYSGYPGTTNEWRRRPAYDALRNLSDHLTGYKLLKSHCSRDGLEVHEFTNDEHICLIAWTTNGRAARVKECIEETSLELVEQILNSTGEAFQDTPDFITESPVFFRWRADGRPQIKSEATLLYQATVAPAPTGTQFYEFDTNRWRGMILAKSKQEAELLADALQPDQIGDREEKSSLRKSRNAIWAVEDPRDADEFVVVKKPARIAWHKRILDRNKPSKALRSWNGTCELMRKGVNTPKVIAYFESKRKEDIFDNWFICENVKGGLSVRNFFTRFASGETEIDGFTFESFTAQLIRFVMVMHQKGIFFRDLAGGNVLIESTQGGELSFTLIDTARIRCSIGALKLGQRLEDLMRLTNKLNQEQQMYFMNTYLKKLGKQFTPMQRISFALYDMKTVAKRYKRRLLKKFR